MFCDNDQRLVNFALKHAKKVDILVLNCNIFASRGLKGVSKTYILSGSKPISK